MALQNINIHSFLYDTSDIIIIRYCFCESSRDITILLKGMNFSRSWLREFPNKLLHKKTEIISFYRYAMMRAQCGVSIHSFYNMQCSIRVMLDLNKDSSDKTTISQVSMHSELYRAVERNTSFE